MCRSGKFVYPARPTAPNFVLRCQESWIVSPRPSIWNAAMPRPHRGRVVMQQEAQESHAAFSLPRSRVAEGRRRMHEVLKVRGHPGGALFGAKEKEEVRAHLDGSVRCFGVIHQF